MAKRMENYEVIFYLGLYRGDAGVCSHLFADGKIERDVFRRFFEERDE
jgi:hypothetical protein